MDRATIRDKIADLAVINECEVTRAKLDHLEAIFDRGYSLPMPSAWVEMLPRGTLEEQVYYLGQLTRLTSLRAFLSVGRSKLVPRR